MSVNIYGSNSQDGPWDLLKEGVEESPVTVEDTVGGNRYYAGVNVVDGEESEKKIVGPVYVYKETDGVQSIAFDEYEDYLEIKVTSKYDGPNDCLVQLKCKIDDGEFFDIETVAIGTDVTYNWTPPSSITFTGNSVFTFKGFVFIKNNPSNRGKDSSDFSFSLVRGTEYYLKILIATPTSINESPIIRLNTNVTQMINGFVISKFAYVKDDYTTVITETQLYNLPFPCFYGSYNISDTSYPYSTDAIFDGAKKLAFFMNVLGRETPFLINIKYIDSNTGLEISEGVNFITISGVSSGSISITEKENSSKYTVFIASAIKGVPLNQTGSASVGVSNLISNNQQAQIYTSDAIFSSRFRMGNITTQFISSLRTSGTTSNSLFFSNTATGPNSAKCFAIFVWKSDSISTISYLTASAI